MSTENRSEFDVRVVNFHLRRQTVSYKEFDKHLADLPDDAENCEETEARFTNSYEQRHVAEFDQS
ncbi:MAG: hypothetical protein ACI9MC_001526 [Kiritimatiellia bacterium]|jgi:hypothetical protein